jgi:hypothetical protein
VRFHAIPTGAGAGLLHHNHHLNILLWIAYQPDGGKPSFQKHYFLVTRP